jgi:hypothetical protein
VELAQYRVQWRTLVLLVLGCAKNLAVSCQLPLLRPGFDLNSDNVGSVVDEAEMGQVFSEYFGFNRQFSFHQMLHTHVSPRVGTKVPLVAWVRRELGLTSSISIKKLSIIEYSDS